MRPGDTVAVVSPAFGGVGRWPRRVSRGTRYLESLGLNVRLMPNAACDEGWASTTAERRAADLHEAFADESVGVVLCGIGGNHSNQLLPLLDFDLIAGNPKVFQGYSDITVLHWAIAADPGLVTFHGPALVPELGEVTAVLPFTDRFLRAAWFGNGPILYGPAPEWTDEFLDWDASAELERARALRCGGGWRTVRGGRAAGVLFGGCLETICWHLKGSAAWVDLTGVILVLEPSEQAPSPADIDAYLTDLEHLGVFDAAAALVFARPAGYAPDDVELLWEVVERRTEASGIPVLAGVDAGHTDPMLTLPFGVPSELDADRMLLALTEAPTVP